jgi:hypothetical protein
VIELGKEYRTREGSLVRLYTVNGADASQPIVGERFVRADVWVVSTWDTQGRYINGGTEHKFDLIEAKPVRVFERWVNVYRCGLYTWHSRRFVADQFAADRIACLHIRQEYHEGDGLCDSEKT